MPQYLKKYVQTVNKNKETGLSTCENYDKVRMGKKEKSPFEVKLNDE